MMRKLPRIAITMGDPTGVGPEIVVKAVSDPGVYTICNPVIVGDKGILKDVEQRSKYTMHDTRYTILSLSNINPKTIKPGEPDLACGRAMATYIEKAVEMVLRGEIDALVTAPINKDVLNRAGYRFPGHTEFLADLTGTEKVCMMLASDKLRVSLVTTHAPLKDVPHLLTTEKIVDAIVLTFRSLVELFGLESPRLGVASLNPHGGEKGIFGAEEETIILPAVREAQRSGVPVSGPFSPDSLFHRAHGGEFDAVVAMYHDQGLIPLKLLSFRQSVNITLGLPIIRTSVDHGTAYDIAGLGVADPTSLINAISVAVEMARKKSQSVETLKA
jgi:4-hydroxythreonine-4-phosphate dehydrogenase